MQKLDNVYMPFKVYALMKKGGNTFLKSTQVNENTVQSALRKAEEYFYALAKRGKEKGKYQIVMYKNV